MRSRVCWAFAARSRGQVISVQGPHVTLRTAGPVLRGRIGGARGGGRRFPPAIRPSHFCGPIRSGSRRSKSTDLPPPENGWHSRLQSIRAEATCLRLAFCDPAGGGACPAPITTPVARDLRQGMTLTLAAPADLCLLPAIARAA